MCKVRGSKAHAEELFNEDAYECFHIFQCKIQYNGNTIQATMNTTLQKHIKDPGLRKAQTRAGKT